MDSGLGYARRVAQGLALPTAREAEAALVRNKGIRRAWVSDDQALRRIRYAIFNRRLEAELAEEIEAHRPMREERVRCRKPPRDGQRMLAREDADACGRLLARKLWQEWGVCHAIIRRKPGFAISMIL